MFIDINMFTIASYYLIIDNITEYILKTIHVF